MNIEFHYHITYILARKSGFDTETASTIAYASQYTDDNNEQFQVLLKDGSRYRNYISQTFNILKPKNRLVRIYTCFHFFPGNYDHPDSRRIDGSMHLFNTTAGSDDARKMLDAALETGDPCRIGIAAHCFSDSWAHQNFVGFRHDFGAAEGMLQTVTPNIGHADFGYLPDIPALVWKDPRLIVENSVIRNTERFMGAARAVFFAFAERNNLGDIESRWDEVEKLLRGAIGEDCDDYDRCMAEQPRRIAACGAICPEMPEYDKCRWLQEVSDRRLKMPESWPWRFFRMFGSRARKFHGSEGFRGSRWFQFQEAVKQHQSWVMDLHGSRYRQIGAGVVGVL